MAVKRTANKKDPSDKAQTNKDRCQVNVRLTPELLQAIDNAIEVKPMTRSDFFVKAAAYFCKYPELLDDDPTPPVDKFQRILELLEARTNNDSDESVDNLSTKTVDNSNESDKLSTSSVDKPIEATAYKEIDDKAKSEGWNSSDLSKRLLWGTVIGNPTGKPAIATAIRGKSPDKDFEEWSRLRDPDGIGWVQVNKIKKGERNPKYLFKPVLGNR
ncbi:hypothetical protein NG799_29085 [Laspinema sp. D1]|uniref:Ribbon-helix-helix protein CopG domain-containing protein n=1 Tax=Laspinema palackyanum D2a TaxID=2953684 RepID=A0ABT2N039_9CYAN|nr:hypothetical protein [Laspinema sp. D2a]